jgi:hypothetical protein
MFSREVFRRSTDSCADFDLAAFPDAVSTDNFGVRCTILIEVYSLISSAVRTPMYS